MKILYLFAPIFYLFSLNLNGQNPCLESAQISVQSTSLGSPLSGPFQPNEEIVLDLFVNWNGLTCNWIHGLSPTFGNGWSPSSFDNSGTPEVISPLNEISNGIGNPGNFFWYDDNVVTYKNYESPNFEFGESVPAGWYSTATTPGNNNPCGSGQYFVDPNCSCGIIQPCDFFFSHHLRIKLITGSQEDCDNGLTDLGVDFKLFTDFETGNGVNSICADIPVISEFFQMTCSIPTDLEINPQEIDIYSDENLTIDFTNYVTEVNPEVSYQWTETSEDQISGASNCWQNCGTTLSQQLINSDLYETKTVTYSVNAIRSDGTAGPVSLFLVKIHPDIYITTYYDVLQPICSGVTEVIVESTAFGGAMENDDVEYSYLWNTGQTESSISAYPEITTTYEVTITDQLGTTKTSAVTVEVIPTPELTWNTQILPTYCVGEEYLICVDPVEENTIFEWDVNDANLTIQEANNCIGVSWNELVSNPFICVQYTNQEGCLSNELCHRDFTLFEVSNCLVVANEELEANPIIIYPNPSYEWATIEAESLERLKMVDVNGQILWSKKLSGESSFQLNTRDFSNGIYYLLINEKEIRKLVILR